MYTHIKGVQILVSLLKQYNIKHIVLSPGTRNTALAHSVETDDFFECYSIVDERSAGYFALGISEALGVPVCVSCTAATATCNYLPAMQEAYERNIQLIALTADQDAYEMFHMEDQCIDQVDMFHGFVKCAVDVPKVETEHDYWYFNRRVNEAFLELDHHGKGPVQINYHMPYSLDELARFEVRELPVTRKINRYDCILDWKPFSDELINKKRILVVGGSDYEPNGALRQQLKLFTEKYNCVVVCDTFSNVRQPDSEKIILPKTLGDVINHKEVKDLTPDLIITFGNVYYSTIKYFLQGYAKNVTHWQIAIDGILNDGYHCLTKVFECRPEDFFAGVNAQTTGKNDDIYYNVWKNRMDQIHYPDLGFTHFKVIEEFCKRIPANAVLHTSVLDSIRISNYVDMNPGVRCFANIGADGIDGALSTFLGQAEKESIPSFLLIGDLSLMYDMNAMLHFMSDNVRILVINNYAGAEFHKNFGIEKIPTLNQHIAAGHHVKIEQCHSLSNLEYLSANNLDSLKSALDIFVQNTGGPKLLEVFTDAHTDANTLKQYWRVNQNAVKEGAVQRTLKRVVNKKARAKIKGIIHAIKE